MNRIDSIRREIAAGSYPRHSGHYIDGIEVNPRADAEVLLGEIARQIEGTQALLAKVIALEGCIRKIKATANGPITMNTNGKDEEVGGFMRASIITGRIDKLAAEVGIE